MHNLGPFTPAQLAAHGITRNRLRQLIAAGELTRVAHGWYADAATPEDAIRAVKLGGRLGCLSVCARYGIWVPHNSHLHVMIGPGDPAPTHTPHGVVYHRRATPGAFAAASLHESLGHVIHRHEAETALIALESAVSKNLITPTEAKVLLADTPCRAQRLTTQFSPTAQSGSETRLRLFFQQRNVPVTPQFHLAGVGRVDLLVGRSWIIEADSVAFHSSAKNVTMDCHRDMLARKLGYTTTRLSYHQIWGEWEQTQLDLLLILRSRKHTAPPNPL